MRQQLICKRCQIQSMDLSKTKNNRSRGLLLFILLISIFGFFIRLNAAIKQSFWQDEVFIFNVSRSTSPEDILFLRLQDRSHPQLYYLFMHYWQKIDTSVLFLRLPSVIASSIAIYFVYLIGKTTLNSSVGLLSSLVYAMSPFYAGLGFQAKFYPFVFLLVFMSLYFLLTSFEQKMSNFRATTAALCAALAFYIDYSTMWYLGILGAVLVIAVLGHDKKISVIVSPLLKTLLLTLIFISFSILPLALDLPYILKSESFFGEKRLVAIDISIKEFLGFHGYSSYLIPLLFYCLFFREILKFLGDKFDTKLRFFALFIIAGAISPLLIMYGVSHWFPAINARNLWISGLIVPFGFAAWWMAAVKKRSMLPIMILGLPFLIFNFSSSLFRPHYFSGKTDWGGLIDSAISYQSKKKVFIFLDYEDPYWNRMGPLRDYYAKGYDHQMSISNYKIVTVPMQSRLDEEMLKLYSSLDAVWILYSGEFLDPWSLNSDERQKIIENVKAAQLVLHCENKPCKTPVIIYD